MFLLVWISLESVAGGGINGRGGVEVMVYGLWVLVYGVVDCGGEMVWCGGELQRRYHSELLFFFF